MVESMKSEPRPPQQGGGPDGGGLYDTSGIAPNGGVINNGVAHHPLSSANPPGLPRPAMPHTHGHSHLIAAPGGVLNNATIQHNGSPMTRLAHQRKSQPPTLFSRNKGNKAKVKLIHTTPQICAIGVLMHLTILGLQQFCFFQRYPFPSSWASTAPTDAHQQPSHVLPSSHVQFVIFVSGCGSLSHHRG